MLALPVILFFGSLKNSRAVDGVIWNKRDCDFVPIFSVSSFFSAENERLKAATRELEFHNFQGSDVKVTYFEESNLISFYDNNTKITGILGDVWTILADYLNFTLIPVKSEERTFGNDLGNGTFNGLVGSVQRSNETTVIARSGLFLSRLSILDYTMPLWSLRYHVYIKPEWKYDEYWVLHLFSIKAWSSYFLLLFALSVLGYVYEKHSTRSHKNSISFNLQDHVFYTVGLASAQGYVPRNFHKNSKLIYICTSVFSWIFLIALNSNAIFLMTNKKYDLPFTDLKTMIQKSNYDIVAFKGSQVHRMFDEKIRLYFRYPRDSIRVQYVASTTEVYKKVCSSKKRKLSAFEAEDRHKAFGGTMCKLVPIKASYFRSYIASAVGRGFKFKRSFDTGILKIIETGILGALKSRWMNLHLEDKDTAPFQSVDMNQVNFIFTILWSGLGMSVLTLFVENVTFMWNSLTSKVNFALDKMKTIRNTFMKNKQ